MPDNDTLNKLSGILDDPEAMAKIMSIAGSLMGGAGGSDVGKNMSDDAAAVQVSADEGSAKKSDDTVNAPSDMPDLSALLPVISGIMNSDKKNDPRTNLLYALKPYMSHERGEKIDMLIKAMRLASIAGGFFSDGKA